MFAEASQISYGSEMDKYLRRAKPGKADKWSHFPFALIKHHFQESAWNSCISEELLRLVVHLPASRAGIPPLGFGGSWCTSAPPAIWEGGDAAPHHPAVWHRAAAFSQEEFPRSQAPVVQFQHHSLNYLCVGARGRRWIHADVAVRRRCLFSCEA